MMRRADFEGAKKFLERLVKDGLYPEINELNILLRGATTEDEADETIEIANELEISRDCQTYGLLAPYKARPHAFDVLIDDMREDGIARDSGFYQLALRRSKDFAVACFLYGRMKAGGVAPDLRIYRRFCDLSRVPSFDSDFDTAAKLNFEIASIIRQVGTSSDIASAGLEPSDQS